MADAPKVGDTVRLNTPERQDLNANSPMLVMAIDEATGLVTLKRESTVLKPEIPITLSMLVKVDPPPEAPPYTEPEPEPEPPTP